MARRGVVRLVGPPFLDSDNNRMLWYSALQSHVRLVRRWRQGNRTGRTLNWLGGMQSGHDDPIGFLKPPALSGRARFGPRVGQ